VGRCQKTCWGVWIGEWFESVWFGFWGGGSGGVGFEGVVVWWGGGIAGGGVVVVRG